MQHDCCPCVERLRGEAEQLRETPLSVKCLKCHGWNLQFEERHLERTPCVGSTFKVYSHHVVHVYRCNDCGEGVACTYPVDCKEWREASVTIATLRETIRVIEHDKGSLHNRCCWCNELYPDHRDDCMRQKALATEGPQ